MIIKKIDGQVVSADEDVAKYLNRKVGDFTLLDITDERGKNTQQITVKPISLGAEYALRYQRWVDINEAEVLKRSNGRLGYVHISGMGDANLGEL